MAWYPLNGDLKNRGLEDYNIVDKKVIYEKGKIGKTVAFNESFLKVDGCPIKNTIYSISLWFKITKTNVAHTLVCSRTQTGFGFSIFILQSNKLRIDASILETNHQWIIDYICETDKWTHLILTNNNGDLSLYINGELYANKTVTVGTGKLGNYMSIGASSRNNSTIGDDNYLYGNINDLRIYDHILSKAEIKEIYRTPILKYSFDYPAIDPLISTATKTEQDISGLFNGGQNRYTDIGKIIYNNAYIIDNNYFTISFDMEIKDLTVVDGFLGKLTLQDNTYDTVLETQKWGTIVTTDIKNRSNIFLSSDGTKEIILSKNGKYHIVRTYQLKDTARFIQNWNIQIRADNISGGTATISNFKVVLGKNEIPYDGTNKIFYDESGLGNDGVLIGQDTFLPTSYSTESKIGEGCYVSKTKTDLGENTYGIIKVPTFCEIPEISICFWVYVPLTDNSAEDNVFLGYSYDSNNYGIYIRRYSTTVAATIYGARISAEGLTRGAWNHIVVTAQKVGNINIYINGELKASGTIPSGIDWETAILTIGDLRENRGLSFDGKIDDLIIYATALSEKDVKKQYMDVIKVDNDGNLYCKKLDENVREVEYLESNGTQWIDTGIKTSDKISFEISFEDNEIITYDRFFFGATDNNTSRFYLGYGWDNNNTGFAYGGSINQLDKIGSKKRATIKFDVDKNLYVNGIKENISISTFGGVSLNIYLFTRNVNGNKGVGTFTKIYYCKIWKNGEIVRDLLPTISTEEGHIGEACLFDTVTNTYFYNQGTGKFTTNLDESTTNIDFTSKGIVNTDYIIEGKDKTKILNDGNIIEVNNLYEN